MQLMPVLEVAISLVLLYLFFSQVVTSIFEFITSHLNYRGRYLRKSLSEALNSGNDKNWAELMYRHPSVDILAQTAKRPPTYVPSSVFVKAIVDLVIDEARQHEFIEKTITDANGTKHLAGEYEYRVTEPVASPGTTLIKLEAGLQMISPGDFKSLLQTLLLNARGCTPKTPEGGDESIFKEFLEGLGVWYDTYMEQVTGRYKRAIRPWLFLLGFTLAVAFNLDSLYVAHYFWTHAEARRQVADYATKVAQAVNSSNDSSKTTRYQTSNPSQPPIKQQLQAFYNHADSLTAGLQQHEFPIGWTLSAATDSAKLPDSFFVYQPAEMKVVSWWDHLVSKEPRQTHNVSYWIHYQRSKKTNSQAKGKARQVTFIPLPWKRDTLLNLPEGQNLHLRSAAIATRPGNLNRPWGLILLGWFFTGAALSFGAPFWFELLSRFVNMRNLGLRPPTATKQSSKEPS